MLMQIRQMILVFTGSLVGPWKKGSPREPFLHTLTTVVAAYRLFHNDYSLHHHEEITETREPGYDPPTFNPIKVNNLQC